MLFFFVLHLQVTAGYPALAAGAANTPITLLLLAGSPLTGALSRRSGPRLPMTAGCLLAALGAVALRHVGPHAVYWRDVLPPVTLYGLGMMCIVAPLTAGVLAAADVRHAGVASGVNNAVARAGSLLAVASLPALVGLVAYADPVAVDRAYRTALWYCAGLMLAGALLSATLPRRGAPVPLRRDQP